jgi:hypothetical protein
MVRQTTVALSPQGPGSVENGARTDLLLTAVGPAGLCRPHASVARQ